MSGSNIGMMDPAYFVGRKAILQWINTTFAMSVPRIEDTASGAVACQILDAVYPGEVPMSKVRWDAKSPHEFIENYKIIQRVFDKKGIDKYIDVEKLMRAKYQDNLENMQWFKSFYEKNFDGRPYDPVARRAKGRGADAMAAFAVSTAGDAEGEGAGAGAPAAAATAAAAPRAAPHAARSTAAGGSPSTAGPSSGAAPARTAAVARARPGAPSAAPAAASPPHAGAASAAARQQIASLTEQVAELRTTVESLEKERDFYFGKLRDIEILMQTYTGPDKPMVDSILKIMYATEEDFVAVDESGAPILN